MSIGKLLDTALWQSLTPRQKAVMTAISGHGAPFEFLAKDTKVIERLETLGLVTVDWDNFTATEVDR